MPMAELPDSRDAVNLLFRLVLVFIRSSFRSRIDVLDESTVTFRVLPTDFDLYLHLNNGRYLSLMDAARLDLIIRNGLFRVMMRRRWFPVVGSAIIRYRRSIGAFRRFTVRTRLLGFDARWVYLEQRFEVGGELMAVGAVKGIFRHGGTTIAPKAMLAEVGFHGPSPLLPDWVHTWSQAEATQRQDLGAP